MTAVDDQRRHRARHGVDAECRQLDRQLSDVGTNKAVVRDGVPGRAAPRLERPCRRSFRSTQRAAVHPSCRVDRIGPSLAIQRPTIRPSEGGSSAGPLTPPLAAASSLSMVGSHRCRLSVGSPDHVSAVSSPGGRAQYPAGYPRRSAGGAGLDLVVSRCVSTADIRFLVLLCPPRSWAFLTVGLPAKAGPRRGFRVSHARAAIGVGALSTPGTVVLILTAVARRPAPAACQPLVPKPRHDIPSMQGSGSRSINQGFTRVHPSDLPLACDPLMEQEPLRLSSELRTPQLSATHVEVGTRR